MNQFKGFGLLFAALFALSACGSGGALPAAGGGTGSNGTAAQPTSAPAATAGSEATSAPASTSVPAATTGGDITAVPAATASDEATSAPAAGEVQVDKSKLAKELHWYNWSDYIDPAILEDFEKEYGVKVVVDLYDQNEDMLAKIQAGNSGYDLVTPSDYAVQIMAADKLLAPLDKSKLPNLKDMKPQNMDLYFDKGNVYSVPYMFGITGIAYNKSKFPTPPDSWSALFDPQQIETYKGEFSMLDDERETPGAALKYIGKSLNDTDPADLKKVEEILKTQKPFVAAYNSTDTNRKLASGEYIIAHCWSGSAMQARQGLGDEFSGNPDIAFVIPKEGGMIWQDNLVVLASSPNAYTAHVFMNFLMRPDIAARNTEYIGYLTPNAAAEEQLSPETQALYKEGFAPDEETYKRLEWAVRDEKTAAFTDLWTAVKGE
jgi:spermidine/putrescine transport system substrate-binding protein